MFVEALAHADRERTRAEEFQFMDDDRERRWTLEEGSERSQTAADVEPGKMQLILEMMVRCDTSMYFRDARFSRKGASTPPF